jgi:simple sugar transport system permease protein
LLGAYLFGFVGILQLFWQAGDGAISIPPQFLNMAPYLATIAALVVIASRRGRLQAPGCLGVPLPVKA